MIKKNVGKVTIRFCGDSEMDVFKRINECILKDSSPNNIEAPTIRWDYISLVSFKVAKVLTPNHLYELEMIFYKPEFFPKDSIKKLLIDLLIKYNYGKGN